MKAYIGENKWSLTIEIFNEKTKKSEKHFIAIPPTDNDRIDIIIMDKLILGYNMDIDPIIIVIKKGNVEQIIMKT